MDQRIQQLLDSIQTISPDELTELEGLITEAYKSLKDSTEPATAESVNEMTALIDGLTSQRTEVTRRADEAAALQAQADEVHARAEALLNPPEEPAAKATPEEPAAAAAEEPAPAKAEDGDDGKRKPGDAPEPAAEEPLLEPVTASGRGALDQMIPTMAAVNGRAQASPGQAPAENPYRAVVAAAANVPGFIPGQELTSPDELGEAVAEKLSLMGRSGDQERALVASVRWKYPEDRYLGSDAAANTKKINAVCGTDAGRYDASGALVATGGICLPVNVDYSVPTWSSADRPLRDGLPAFQADRGGIRFVTPPDIGVPSLAGTTTGAGNAVGIWTEATDANPAGATKPVWTVACGAEQLVYVNAITTRVQFGNMESRFAPEQVAANTQQAIAVSARQAELELFTLMLSASFVKPLLPLTSFGASRDLLGTLELLKAQYIQTHRLPRSTAFTVVMPEWGMDVIKADLLRETAHDNAGPRDVLAITDAEVDALFAARNVNVIWMMDGLAGSGTYGNVTWSNQAFSIPGTGGSQPVWPGQTAATSGTSAEFYLWWLFFVEGTYQFLDGGRLDLGVVRDSLLDSTNDYETFVETFEGIAGRGIDAYAVKQKLMPTGVSGGTAALTSYAGG